MRFEMLRMGPFMRHLSLHYGDIATDGAIRLMARTGVRGVTLRTLGDEFNCTPQTVRQWFGGTEPMWAQIATRFGQRWTSSLTDVFRADPDRSHPRIRNPHHLLPFDADEIAATRAWLALSQLARDDEAIGSALAPSLAREIEIVEDCLSHTVDVDPISVDVLAAVVHGLRVAVTATQMPMSLARAHAVLDRTLELLPEPTTPNSGNSFT